MVSSACDPLRVPEEFWAREDVGRGLDRRDVGELFRLLGKHLGASQTRIGTATGLAQGTVCVIMNGSRQVIAIDVLERIADGLGMPDTARVRLGLAPRDRSLVLKGSGKCARQGRRAECIELLAEAQELHERLPARPPGRLGVDNNMVASRAIASRITSSCIWLADYKQAETHARAALAVYESTAPANRSPSREAVARIDLGIALVHIGALDEAVGHGGQALSSARVTDTVLSRAGELDRAILTCFPQEAIAQSFHEQYRETTRRARNERI